MNLENLVHLLAQTHQSLHQRANRAVDFALVVRNWLFGYHIVEFEQQGEDRAQYGQRLLDGLSRQLRAAGIPGCSVSNLKNFRRFYEAYPQIRQTLSGELMSEAVSPLSIGQQLAGATGLERLAEQFRVSWSHYQVLMGLKDAEERRFYEIESVSNGWNVRELERQIASALFERLALSRDLVFYHRLLRCYVLIDLKLDKLTHQDLGQMQMYVNFFDRYVKTEGENPTIGIVLCKRKKDALIELTLPKNATIFASQYQLYLPSKEELRQQLEDAILPLAHNGLES